MTNVLRILNTIAIFCILIAVVIDLVNKDTNSAFTKLTLAGVLQINDKINIRG